MAPNEAPNVVNDPRKSDKPGKLWATMDEILHGEPDDRKEEVREQIAGMVERGFIIREWRGAQSEYRFRDSEVESVFVYRFRNSDVEWDM